MNRRTFFRLTASAALGLTVVPAVKALDLRVLAPEDAPGLSGITRALYALPEGNWTLCIGDRMSEKVLGELAAVPEQIPARDGVFSVFPDFHPWRYSERRKLIAPFLREPTPYGVRARVNPVWNEAPLERVVALKQSSGAGYDSAVAFCVDRHTFEVDAYRPEVIV
jgi:hypothetical protein